MILRGCLTLGLGLIAALATPRAAGVTVLDLTAALDECGLVYTTNAPMQAAVQAYLGAVDAGARLVPLSFQPPPPPTNLLSEAELWPEGIGYLKLAGLYEGVGALVCAELKTWADEFQSGLIVDLRGAGGYDLAALDAMIGLFVADTNDLYVVEDTRGEIRERHRARREGALHGMPLMVIVDPQTRGASELLSAILRGHGRVMVLGQVTPGDAGVRELVPVGEDQAAWIATCRFRLANKPDYAGQGVQPDILVNGTSPQVWVPEEGQPGFRDRELSDKARDDRALMRKVADDAVLRRSVDVLLGLKALGLYEWSPTNRFVTTPCVALTNDIESTEGP